MKKAIGLASLTALLAAGTAATGMAQITVAPTNVTLDLDFYLTTVSQGTVVTNGSNVINGVQFGSITESSIIKDLGTSTSNTFSRRAELALVTPVNDPDDWTVLVKDGSNTVDVTGFFTFTPGTNSVGRTVINSSDETVSDTSYSIDGFALHDATNFPPLTTHFHVRGFTVITTRGVVPTAAAGLVGVPEGIGADVSGQGETGGNLLIIEGLVTAHPNNEVVMPAPVSSTGLR
jgi:hypothetical protein